MIQPRKLVGLLAALIFISLGLLLLPGCSTQRGNISVRKAVATKPNVAPVTEKVAAAKADTVAIKASVSKAAQATERAEKIAINIKEFGVVPNAQEIIDLNDEIQHIKLELGNSLSTIDALSTKLDEAQSDLAVAGALIESLAAERDLLLEQNNELAPALQVANEGNAVLKGDLKRAWGWVWKLGIAASALTSTILGYIAWRLKIFAL